MAPTIRRPYRERRCLRERTVDLIVRVDVVVKVLSLTGSVEVPIPEPATMALLAAGLVGLGRRRK